MSIGKLNTMIVGGAIALSGLFVAALLLPGLKELRRRRTEIAEKVEEMKAHQAQLGSVSDLYDEIVTLDKRTNAYRKQLPAERQFGEFLRAISDELRHVGVDQNIVQPRTEERLELTRLPTDLKAAGATKILPVQVSFDSTFTQAFEFLKAVEELPRLSHVESIDITNDEHSPSHVHAEITLITFYYPEEDAPRL